MKYSAFLIASAQAAWNMGACTKIDGADQVVQNLDLTKGQGKWYMQYMDTEGIHGYFPQCVEANIFKMGDADWIFQWTEYQNDRLSGLVATYDCAETGNAVC